MTHTFDQLDDLLDTCGGSAYILLPDRFAANVDAFLGAFRAHYPHTNLGYSYKTNYLPALCVEAHRRGLYAEVVSGMEYEIARACGVPHDRIIFNGPVKTEAELDTALTGGARVNADSLDELATIATVVSQHPDRRFSIGLRCNLEMAWQGRASRFGLSDANGDLRRAAEAAGAMPNVRLAGLHCHFSYDRSAASYARRMAMMIEIAERLWPHAPPDYLDLGGGFCGPMPPALREQRPDEPPTFTDYADAVAPRLVEAYGTDDGPELILEPGVGLVADTMSYACRVQTTKRFPGRNVAVTAGSVDHLKIVANEINLPMGVLRSAQPASTDPPAPIDVVGFTCLEHDLMYRDCEQSISKGDILVFDNVGAYSFVTASPFIRTTPPIVTGASGGGWRTLMRQTPATEFIARFNW